MKQCSLWNEYDLENGQIYEYCAGKQIKGVSCSGVENQCNFPKYFCQPQKICRVLRAKDRIQDTIADVERFR